MRSTNRSPSAARPRLAALLLALAWLAAPVALPGAAGAADLAQLTLAEGTVEVGLGDPPRFRPARAGEALPAGAVVRTGPGSRAEVRRGGETLRLYADTLLRLDPGPDATRVELERGRSLFDVLRGSGRGFEVRTREVAVMVKGTRFLVDAEGGFVSVFRGLVGVDDLLGSTGAVDVREGLSLGRADAGAPLELMVTPFADPWQDWSGDVPAPLLEQPASPVVDPETAAAHEVRQALAEGPADPAGALPPAAPEDHLEPSRLDPVLDVPRAIERPPERRTEGPVLSEAPGAGGPAAPGLPGGDPNAPSAPESPRDDPDGLLGSVVDGLLGPDSLLGGLLGGGRR